MNLTHLPISRPLKESRGRIVSLLKGITMRLRHFIFWIPLAGCTYLALIPNPDPLASGHWFNHVVAFGYLTPALWFAHYGRAEWRSVVLWMLIYSIALEMVQELMPVRTAEVWDIGSNMIGIVAGASLYATLVSRFPSLSR